MNITHELSLVINIRDIDTKLDVVTRDISIERGNKKMQYIHKGGGQYVFINLGKNDFKMYIKALGYKPQNVDIVYSELDPKIPILDVFLERKKSI